MAYNSLSAGFPVSTLDYAPYTPQKDNMNTCFMVGIAALVVFLTLSKPQSPMYHPVAHRAGMHITSMVASVGHTISARAANGIAAVADVVGGGSSNEMPASASKSTSDIPSDSKVTLIDSAASAKDQDAWKSMTDAEKASCEKAARAVIARHAKAVVMIFAPWCPHCHTSMASYAAAASSSKLPFYMINAEALPRSAFSGANAIFNLEYFPSYGYTSNGTTITPVNSVADIPEEAAASAKVATATPPYDDLSSSVLDHLF